MRRIAGTFVTLGAAALVVTSATGQDPQPRRAAPARNAGAVEAPAPNPAMEGILLDWAKHNGKLTTLSVAFIRTDTSKVWGKEEYTGNAYLQSPNLACLHFKKVNPANPKKADDHERIVCTGQEVRQYDYKTQQIFVFPLDKNARKRAIQEGPLPFLFNMKADEARRRYDMVLKGEDKENFLIEVIPLEQRDQEVFSRAYIQLSRRTYLPDRLLLVDPNGKDRQDYKFTQVSQNGAINPVFFQGLNIKGWKVVDNPAPAQGAPVGAAPAGRPQAGPRPAVAGRRAP
jgi:TIGR03009 family protein